MANKNPAIADDLYQRQQKIIEELRLQVKEQQKTVEGQQQIIHNQREEGIRLGERIKEFRLMQEDFEALRSVVAQNLHNPMATSEVLHRQITRQVKQQQDWQKQENARRAAERKQ
jgi:hypothetical protein